MSRGPSIRRDLMTIRVLLKRIRVLLKRVDSAVSNAMRRYRDDDVLPSVLDDVGSEVYSAMKHIESALEQIEDVLSIENEEVGGRVR